MSATQHDEFRPFEVDVNPEPDGVRVSPHGEIDIATADRLQKRVAEKLAAGALQVTLDLTGVTFMDSTGIRLLVHLTRASHGDGWEFSVVHVPPSVRRVLELSGVVGALPLSDPEPV